MARVRMDLDMGEIRVNIEKLDAKLDEAVNAVMHYHAASGVGYMKQNAPWTDRTGAARSGLFTIPEHAPGRHTIIFAHSVPYGIWLEVKNSGRYEIIMPSVRKIGHDVMASLNHVMRKL